MKGWISMSLLSFRYLVFVAAGLLIYYLIPKKFRWIVLLVMSVGFYASAGVFALIFVGVSILSVWAAALFFGKVDSKTKALLKGEEIDKRKAIKNQQQKKKRVLLWSVLILNLGVLFLMKYCPKPIDLIVPLGLSFYTFQSIGYLVDVYWKKAEPEKNLAKYACFILFFPQIVQGPIGRFEQLHHQLMEGHDFQFNQIKRALLLILWGIFKKMVIANRLVRLVDYVFDEPSGHSGTMVVVAVLAYSVQQYADFSGGIDLVTGVAELFGIELAPNFKRPYFSSSLTEFWHRWHISLGSWMRDYVFYPLAMTKTMDRLCKCFSKRFGTKVYTWIQMFICNVVVFLLVGVWHGADLHYVFWGLYNGIIIAIESVVKPIAEARRVQKGIQDVSLPRKLMAIAGTFLIVNFGWFFDRSMTLQNAGIMIRNLFTKLHPFQFSFSLLKGFGLVQEDYYIVAIGVLTLFLVSLWEEMKDESIRDKLLQMPIAVRWLVCYLYIFAIIAFATTSEGATAFMYAQF